MKQYTSIQHFGGEISYKTVVYMEDQEINERIILRHVDLLLGNDSLNTFPGQRIRGQQSDNIRCYAALSE